MSLMGLVGSASLESVPRVAAVYSLVRAISSYGWGALMDVSAGPLVLPVAFAALEIAGCALVWLSQADGGIFYVAAAILALAGMTAALCVIVFTFDGGGGRRLCTGAEPERGAARVRGAASRRGAGGNSACALGGDCFRRVDRRILAHRCRRLVRHGAFRRAPTLRSLALQVS